MAPVKTRLCLVPKKGQNPALHGRHVSTTHTHTHTHTPRVEPKMADLTNSGGDTMGQNEVYIVIYTVVYWNVG